MTDQELNEIEARVNAATPGPWIAANRDEIHDKETRFDEHGARIGATANGIATMDCTNVENNRQFIVHARKDVPALLAEVRQLRAERDAIIQVLVLCDECPGNFIDCLNEDHRGSKLDLLA